MEYNRDNRKRSDNKASSLRSSSGGARSAADARQQRPVRTPNSLEQRRERTARPASSGAGRNERPAQRSGAPARRPASSQRPSRPQEARTRSASPERRPASSRPSSQTRRPSTQARQAAARPAKGKKKSGFKKFVLIYGAILLLILIVGLIIFSSFIGNYEKNQPSNIAKTVVDELSGDKASAFLDSHRDMIASMENTDEVINKYLSSISGKDLSYVENSDSRADAPSFDIRADGTTVGKIVLAPDGTGSFGLGKWKLGSLNISEFIPDTYSYTILAPTGYTVAINGNELPESAITKKNETPEILVNAAKFIKDVPKYDSYTAAGLLSVPDVTAKDTSGKDVGVATAKEYFVAGGKPDEAFIKEQKPFVEDALRDWAYHFIHYNADQTRLSYYIQSGSDLYSYIFGSDTMDPIVTTFYDWEYISNVEFTEFEVGNFIKYSDDCYSVDVKYKLKVDFNNDKLSDEGQMLDATWVVVKSNGYWGIADVIYHQGTENTLAQPDNGSSDSAAEEKTTAAENADDNTDAANADDTIEANAAEETTEANADDETTEANADDTATDETA